MPEETFYLPPSTILSSVATVTPMEMLEARQKLKYYEKRLDRLSKLSERISTLRNEAEQKKREADSRLENLWWRFRDGGLVGFSPPATLINGEWVYE